GRHDGPDHHHSLSGLSRRRIAALGLSGPDLGRQGQSRLGILVLLARVPGAGPDGRHRLFVCVEPRRRQRVARFARSRTPAPTAVIWSLTRALPSDWDRAWAIQHDAFLDHVTRSFGGWTPEGIERCAK